MRDHPEIYQKTFDLVIIGAGPVGLTAAFLAGKKGLSVLVVEKQKERDYLLRGETIESDNVIDSIWKIGFDSTLAGKAMERNKLYSPQLSANVDLKKTAVTLNETPVSFHWQKLINAMTAKIKNTLPNITLVYETKVTDVIFPDDQTKPVPKIKVGDKTIQGNLFFDCSGAQTLIGRKFGINYSHINNYIIKSRYKNLPAQYRDSYHTFFIPTGSLNTYPDVPPCFLVIFPDEQGNAEINCQFFIEFGKDGFSRNYHYSKNRLVDYWKALLKHYIVVKDMVNQAQEKGEAYLTEIPAQEIITQPMIYPGLVLLGDAAAFIRCSSSSGLNTGMQGANWWVNQLWKELNKSGSPTLDQNQKAKLNRQFQKWSLFKELNTKFRQFRTRKRLAYHLIRTKSDLYYCWNLIANGYRRIEKKAALNTILNHYQQFLAMDWEQQVSYLNSIISGRIIGQPAERAILTSLKDLKQNQTHWNQIVESLFLFRFVGKLHGPLDLREIKQILGNKGDWYLDLAKKTKAKLIKALTQNLIDQLTILDRSQVLDFLINGIKTNKGKEKINEILLATWQQFSQEDFFFFFYYRDLADHVKKVGDHY
ncbi:MAG: FAD-dependent monooxygenase, partial [Spirochaetes bacterium]|nr:FAD-dependent monooxygenase [Spirochaetota bacterium]